MADTLFENIHHWHGAVRKPMNAVKRSFSTLVDMKMVITNKTVSSSRLTK